ncbi:MAG: hypothetical protein ACI848_000302 [Roseivirga sp.]|jgi:hypothetical protein
MKQLIRNAKQIVILLLVISLVGCDEDTVILPQITSGFTYTIDEDTRTVTFINTSENANSYTWSFGDQAATTSTLNNPIFTYAIGVYTVVLTATNVAGASATFEDTIIFLDLDIPLITLIGDSTMNVTLGDLFTDPGATALDEVDGDITKNIVVGGNTVDTAVEGTYTITYDVTDAQGNEAMRVERIVIVAAISCVAEAEGSLSASNLNLTFMSDPTASVINDGADFSWIDNPDFDNTENASCKVGQITKLGNNPWDNTQIDLDAKLDFNANTGLKIKVWSSVANSEVRIKLEEIGNPGNNIEQFLTTSLTSGWEELTFPFTAADSNKFDKIVMFFDLNANNTDTYYFDDLMLYGTGNGGGTSCTMDATQSLNASNFDLTFMSDPTASIINDGADFSWIDNPDFDNTENASCKVGQITKLGNNPWDNTQIDLDAKLDFNANTGLKIKVWSGLADTQVRIKLEEIGNPGNNVEQELTTSLTSGWEELTFPFSTADSGKFNKIVIFFDLDENNTDTYYFDDLKLYGTGGGGGGGGGTCPTPPAGEFIADGDFEVNGDCWVLFDNGGTTTISTSVSNGGGTNSGQIQTGQGANPGIKQERFGVGTILPNTTYVVSFDIKADAANPLADGAVFQAFTFSEPADGSGLPAAQHVLIAGDSNVAATWTPRSYTFTTAGNVDGGMSLLFELVCGGAATCGGIINIDNVSLTIQ